MFEQTLNFFKQLPIKESDRKCTDCLCTIIGAIFALTLFILAFVFMNIDHYYMSNFPTDSDGAPCAYSNNQQYPYIFFPDINNVKSRVCISMCPQTTGTQLQCKPNSQIPSCSGVNTYASSPQFQRLGGFCAPNTDSARNILVQNLNLQPKWDFLNTYDIIRLSLVIAFGIGLIWMIITQCLPRPAAILSLLLGSATLIACGIILLISNSSDWKGYQVWHYVFAVIFIIFGFIFFVMLFVYKKRIKTTGIFLSHSAKFLSQKPVNFIFIPVFILLLLGLLVLCLFQYLAYSSQTQPIPVNGDIYLQLTQNIPLTLLTIIQLIWGSQFLKDSFNFMISGNAAQWYIKRDQNTSCCTPINRYFKFNFGSVVGGSFINAFFNFIDFIFQLFRCYPEGCCGVCAPLCTSFSKCCGCFFDLVRNDAYAYINLAGIPYCNAARNCQVLCNSSNLFIGKQSVMFFYRLCAHIFAVGTTAIICYFLIKARIGGINLQALLIILLLSYCIATYLIDIHADAAEALQITYLAQQQLKGGNPQNQANDLRDFKQQLRGLDHSYEYDGKC